MRYRVVGAHRETGRDVELIVDAAGESDAAKIAGESGILCSAIIAEPAVTPRPKRWVWGVAMAGGLGIVILGAVIFLHRGRTPPGITAAAPSGTHSLATPVRPKPAGPRPGSVAASTTQPRTTVVPASARSNVFRPPTGSATPKPTSRSAPVMWVNATRNDATLNEVRVGVISAGPTKGSDGAECFAIRIRIENLSKTLQVTYPGSIAGAGAAGTPPSGISLSDDRESTYPTLPIILPPPLARDRVPPRAVEPKDRFDDILTFAMPPAESEYLRLTLSLDGVGVFRLQIPKEMVGKGPRKPPLVMPPTVDELIAAVNDRDKAFITRCEVIAKLGDQGPKAAAAVPVIMKFLAEYDTPLEKSVHTRGAVFYALPKIGEPALPVLLQMLQAERDYDDDHREGLSFLSLNAISRIGPHARSAAPAVISILVSLKPRGFISNNFIMDGKPKPRVNPGGGGWFVSCCQCLAKIDPDPKVAVPGLRKALALVDYQHIGNENNEYGRFSNSEATAALAALATFGPEAKDAVGDLASILGSRLARTNEGFMTQNALIALGKIGPDAAPALPVMRSYLTDFHLQRVAEKAIEQVKQPKAVGAAP